MTRALSRPRAMGLSGTFTASTSPPERSCASEARVWEVSKPLGGATSTVTAKPRPSFCWRAVGGTAAGSRAAGRAATAGRRGRPRTFGGETWRMASRMRSTCRGVVPQQPPTMTTPASTMLRAYSAM